MEAIPDLPPDPWNVLGVQRDADISTIRKAYRKLVLQTHPDKAPEKAAEFCLVQTAYETLSDSDKLKEYHSEVKEYEIYRRREQLLEELARQRDEKSQRATRSSMPRRSETFDTARPREKSYTFRTASPESYDDQSSDRQDDDSDEPRYSTHPRPRMRRSDTTEEHRSRRGFSERQSVRQEAGYFGSMPKHRPEPERERYQASRARAKKATDKARKHDQKMRRDQTTPHSSDDETDEDPPFSPQFEAAAAHIKRSRSSKAKKSAPSRSEFTDFFFGEGARFKLVPVDAMQHAARAHIERTKDRSGARSRPELHRSFPTAPADSPNRAARLQRSESSSGDDTVRQSSRHHADARDKPDSRTRRKGTEDRKAGVAVPPPPPKARSANAPPLSARSSHQESRTGSASAPRHGSVPDVSHRRSPPVERSTTSPAPSARKGSRPSLSHVKVNPYSFKDSGYFSTTPSPPNRTEPNTEK